MKVLLVVVSLRTSVVSFTEIALLRLLTDCRVVGANDFPEVEPVFPYPGSEKVPV